MKSTIPKPNSEYRLVEPNELLLISLNKQEEEKIASFRRSINASPTASGCFALLMGSLFLALNIYTYRLGQYNTESVLALLLGTVIFWSVASLCFLSRIPKNSNCIHAQYGIVNGKWPGIAHSSSGSKRQKYFLDIVFPDTKTRYKQAICRYKDYKHVEAGQKVLAVVFSGRKCKRVYGILLNETH